MQNGASEKEYAIKPNVRVTSCHFTNDEQALQPSPLLSANVFQASEKMLPQLYS